jgi:hypothetical protein
VTYPNCDLSNVLTGVQGEMREQLMVLLLENVSLAAHQARFCAVHWANKLFPLHEARARYICLLAVDDAKVEVRQEARAGETQTQTQTQTQIWACWCGLLLLASVKTDLSLVNVYLCVLQAG